jgi:C1A family cysteine protease
MKAVLALLLGVSSATNWNEEFTTATFPKDQAKDMFVAWAKEFGREYATLEEESYRYGLWFTAMEKIIDVNDQGLSYKLRMNQFGDMTDDEFKLYIHGHKGSCLQVPPLENDVRPTDNIIREPEFQAPASVDWQASGDVTPVKNQGQCGSCWAFASTGALECDYAITKGKLTSLSEQQLVDCTTSYGNYGCNGGWWYNAFNYVKTEGGLCTESAYPYTARDGTCKASTCGTKYNPISSYTKVTPDDETAMTNAVAVGCNAVGVEADQTSFQYYSSGILTGLCGTRIDHGVLAVGYGTSGSQQYWKVKNSWGASWGDQGYIYICKDCGKNGNEGECGINMYPYYTTAA